MTFMTRTLAARKHTPALVRRARSAHWLLVIAVAFLLWLLSAPRLHAQTLYEWREPGGAVTYSQVAPRPQDGVLLRQIDLPALAPESRRAAARVLAHSGASTTATTLRAADARVGPAVASLQASERALRLGQSPQLGERRQLVNGHSRLTKAYFDRIAGLEEAVAHARDGLHAAFTSRDGLASGTE